MKNIMGRESVHAQCYECDNCKPPKIKTGGSTFHCAFLNEEFDTWHYDVPTECPCGGRGWIPKQRVTNSVKLTTDETNPTKESSMKR